MEWGELADQPLQCTKTLALSCNPLVNHCLVPPDCLRLPLPECLFTVGLQIHPPSAITASPHAALPLEREARKLERKTTSCPKAPIRYFCLV